MNRDLPNGFLSLLFDHFLVYLCLALKVLCFQYQDEARKVLVKAFLVTILNLEYDPYLMRYKYSCPDNMLQIA